MVFVSSNLNVTLTCPNCRKSRRQNVSNFFNPETPVKIKCKCSCQHSFSVKLERRHPIRKVKFVPGNINQNRRVIKKKKSYHAAFLIPIFFLIITMLTLTISIILDNGEPKTDYFSIINHGNEIKSIYDNSE